jgi:hypothetical protein
MPENRETSRRGLSRRHMLTAGGAGLLATAAAAATVIPRERRDRRGGLSFWPR